MVRVCSGWLVSFGTTMIYAGRAPAAWGPCGGNPAREVAVPRDQFSFMDSSPLHDAKQAQS